MTAKSRTDRTLVWLSFILLCIGTSWAGAQVTLYEHAHYQGRSFPVTRELPNLASVGFNDMASSLVIRGGQWQLCSDAGFRGRCITLGPGRYPTLRAMGLNDAISSVRRTDVYAAPPGNPGGDLVLYEHDNYVGRAFPVMRDLPNLAPTGFNDVASSLVIRRGRWQLCSDAGFRGRCVVLNPGRYPSLNAMGLNDQLSSVRRMGR
jgi:Beta/Gamma crystallin